MVYIGKYKRFLLVFFFAIFAFLLSLSEVKADSYKHTKYDKIWYVKDYYIVKHKLGEKPAFCIQWNYSTLDNVTYNLLDSPSITESNRFVAGMLIRNIYDNVRGYNLSDDDKHLYLDYTLNTLFKLNGSKDFSSNSKVSQYIKDAKEDVKNNVITCSGNNTSNCFNSENFKIEISNAGMNQIGSEPNFVSNKITLKGLLSSYGNFDTKYTINVTSKNKDVKICKNSNGTNCEGSTITLSSPKSSSYDFYVRVNNAETSSTINISVKGENNASYPYATAYYYSSQYQALMVGGVKNISRTLSRNITLHIPDSETYTITARKVDDYGADLIGSSFRIYMADKNTGREIKSLVNNGSGKSSLLYTFTDFSTSNDWLNYQYCFEESEAPDGYVFRGIDKERLCISPNSGSGSTCYENSTNKESDLEYCQVHSYSCMEGVYNDADNKCIVTNDKFVSEGGQIVRETTSPTVKEECPLGYTEMNFTDDTGNTFSECVKVITEEPGEGGICGDGFEFDPETGLCKGYEKTEKITNSVCDVDGYLKEENDSGEVSCARYSCMGEDYTYNSEGRYCTTKRDSYCKRVSDDKEVDIDFCKVNSSDYTLVTIGNKSIDFVKTNNKNSVTISKRAISGEDELPGAKMKICSTKPNDKMECDTSYVVESGQCSSDDISSGICSNNSDGTMNIYMEWVSDTTARTWRGLRTGVNYYLVETIAPLGYSISSYIPFVVNKDGTITSDNATIEGENKNVIIVSNDLSKILISKKDATNSKELPGATLKLCSATFDSKGKPQMIVDELGNCAVPYLMDGQEAIWVSSDTPKELIGLPAGTYYLIETITPDGYDVAEKILFTLHQDGSVTDINGKALKDNKVVMYDKLFIPPATGNVIVIVVAILAVLAIGGVSFYYFRRVKERKSL